MICPHDANGRVRFVPPPGLTKWPPVDQWTEVEWGCWLFQQAWTPEQVAQYFDHDRFVYGVGITPTGERAGAHNAYEAGVKWLYKPTPQGVTLHATRHSSVTNTLWGGAAGATKSYSARWEAIAMCMWPFREDVRIIFARRELEELRRTHLDKIDGEARRINLALGRDKGNDKAVKVTSQPPVATFELIPGTVAKVVFAHCLNIGDEEKYLSEDYDLAVVDESTRLHWRQIVGFQGRLRNDPKLNHLARLILTTNPGGPSHHESVEHFITKTVSLEKNPLYDPADYQFILGVLYSNPFYMDSDGTFTTYEKRLYMYEPDRRRQLLEGDWGAIVNQFFAFDPALHVRAVA